MTHCSVAMKYFCKSLFRHIRSNNDAKFSLIIKKLFAARIIEQFELKRQQKEALDGGLQISENYEFKVIVRVNTTSFFVQFLHHV